MLVQCFDLEHLGEMLVDQCNMVETEYGVIVRNDNEFFYDYYQPTEGPEMSL